MAKDFDVLSNFSKTLVDNGDGTFSIRGVGGSGGMTIGAPVSGGTANLVLYVDSSGELAQQPDFYFDGSSLTVGGDSLTTHSIFAGLTEFYDADGNISMGVGNTYGGVMINPGYTTSENFRVLGSGAADPDLLTVYPFGNTVAFGVFSDLGGTVSMQAVDASDDTLIIRAVAAQSGYLIAFEASDGTQKFGINPGGDLNFGTASAGVSMVGTSGGALTIDAYGGPSAQVRINGSFGFNVTPVAQSTGWSITNVSSDKSFDASAADLAETRNVLGTLLNQLLSYGLIAT